MQLQKVCSGFLWCAWESEFDEPDDEAGDANLRPYIEELRQDSFDQVRKAKGTGELGRGSMRMILGGLTDFRKLGRKNQQGNEQKHCTDEEVRCLHHIRFRDAIGGQLRSAHGADFC